MAKTILMKEINVEKVVKRDDETIIVVKINKAMMNNEN